MARRGDAEERRDRPPDGPATAKPCREEERCLTDEEYRAVPHQIDFLKVPNSREMLKFTMQFTKLRVPCLALPLPPVASVASSCCVLES